MKIITKTILILFYLITNNTLPLPQNKTEKPIVVVICSYNNSKWTKNTLDSIFSQKYSNFRLIIVDDCSSDDNQQIIQNYIDENDLQDRTTFIKNTQRHRKLFNLYRVLYDCDDDEIVVMVDGDDSLAHSRVFCQLNDIYDNENIWFTYGQYKNVPASQAVLWGHKEMGYCRPVPEHIVKKHAYRYYSFIYMHLRSFRGWLFKLVKLEDLIAEQIDGFEGDFYPASNDVAMYFPMVEMAHTNIAFIPDILYIRNLYSEIVGFKVDRKIQTDSAREIRKKPCYPILFKPQKNRLAIFEKAQSDMFIVCKDSLKDIAIQLNNIKKYMNFLGNIHVFFNGSLKNKALCRKIKLEFPDITFIPYNNEGSKSLKNRLIDSLTCSKNNHCIFTTDSLNIIEPINLSEIIYSLEKTYAYRFYLNRYASQIDSRFITLNDDLCAWKFSSSIKGWRGVNSVDDVILCRKSDLIKDLKTAKLDTIYGLINAMHQITSSNGKVGLFFKQTRVRSSL